MKKVTIITVCFNSIKTIRHTFESVLGQTYPNIEYIVVDGFSSDGTVDIIKEYEPLFQGRMRWISEKDEGIYDAMNKGIKMATGELIGIINSDDYYEENAVEIMANAMTDEKYQILYGAMRVLREGEEDSISISSHKFLQYRMIHHPACFVTKQVYDDFGCYDTTYLSVADYDFMLRMNKQKKIHFEPIYSLIANFTLGGMCSTGLAYEELAKMRRNHGLITEKQYKKIKLQSYFHKLTRKLRGK